MTNIPTIAGRTADSPRIRLLAMDIDGTLVNSRDELTPAVRDALRRAADAGIRLVLATGRRYSRALPFVAPLGVEAPLVTASGALIKRSSDHRTLYRAEFSPGTLERVLAILAREGYQAILYADTFHEQFDFYCAGVETDQAEMLDFLRLNQGCERVHPRLMRDPPEGIFAGFAIGTRQDMLRLSGILESELPGMLYVHVLRSPRYLGHMCEISPHGVTKWSGILRLAAEWGIRDEEICAVGDDVNDIPMIRGSGLGIAMGNALEEVKQAADRVAPRHDEEGLVRVVQWLLE